MKAYVDTNVLVDLVLARKDFLSSAQRVFTLGYAREVSLVISSLSFVNTMFLAKRYGFQKEDVASRLHAIASFVKVADLRGRSVVELLYSDWSDYEDATQYRCAKESNVDCIVTRNKKDFKLSDIEVLTPDEFCNKFCVM